MQYIRYRTKRVPRASPALAISPMRWTRFAATDAHCLSHESELDPQIAMTPANRTPFERKTQRPQPPFHLDICEALQQDDDALGDAERQAACNRPSDELHHK